MIGFAALIFSPLDETFNFRWQRDLNVRKHLKQHRKRGFENTRDDKPMFQSKLLYFLSICGAVVLAFLIPEIFPQFFYTTESLHQFRGALTIIVAFIGAQHMKDLGRPWGWGLFAVSGLGALIILFIPPKAIKSVKSTFDENSAPQATDKKAFSAKNNTQHGKYIHKEQKLVSATETRNPRRELTKTVDDFPVVKQLFEYSESAKDAWSELRSFPEAYRLEFLEALQADPQKNVSELLGDLKKKRATELAPFDEAETNELYRRAMDISPATASEFKKTVELFGSNIKPIEVFEKIKVTAEKRQNAKGPKTLNASRMASLLSTVKDISRELTDTGYSLEFGEVPSVGWLVRPDGSKTAYTGLNELNSICVLVVQAERLFREREEARQIAGLTPIQLL